MKVSVAKPRLKRYLPSHDLIERTGNVSMRPETSPLASDAKAEELIPSVGEAKREYQQPEETKERQAPIFRKEEAIELSGIMLELHYAQHSEKNEICQNLIRYLALDNLLPHTMCRDKKNYSLGNARAANH